MQNFLTLSVIHQRNFLKKWETSFTEWLQVKTRYTSVKDALILVPVLHIEVGLDGQNDPIPDLRFFDENTLYFFIK